MRLLEEIGDVLVACTWASCDALDPATPNIPPKSAGEQRHLTQAPAVSIGGGGVSYTPLVSIDGVGTLLAQPSQFSWPFEGDGTQRTRFGDQAPRGVGQQAPLRQKLVGIVLGFPALLKS